MAPKILSGARLVDDSGSLRLSDLVASLALYQITQQNIDDWSSLVSKTLQDFLFAH